MRILFINPNFNLPPRLVNGIACLSAFMKKHGHTTRFLQISSKKCLRKISQIKKINPDLVLFSVCSNQWEVAKFLAKEIKASLKVKIFAGGPHPTVNPECLEESEYIDGVCRGEGEAPLLDLVNRISAGQSIEPVESFWIRNEKGVVKNEIAHLLENLDELPLPDWSIFEESTVLEYPSFNFSRGCLFACRYCINSTLRRIYKNKGNYVRIKSPHRAIEEIKDKLTKYSLEMINFDDDVFMKDKKWVADFCNRYSKEINLPFNCNARPESIDRETCIALKNSGARMIGIGIESGDEEIRRNVLDRALNDEMIINAFKTAKETGLKTYSFNMVGIPGETKEKFNKTITINQVIAPDDLQLSIFYPFPGTPLGDFCKDNGLIKGNTELSYFNHSILKLKGFTVKEIEKSFDLFEYRVYMKRNFKKAIKYRITKLIRRNRLFNLITAPLLDFTKKLLN